MVNTSTRINFDIIKCPKRSSIVLWRSNARIKFIYSRSVLILFKDWNLDDVILKTKKTKIKQRLKFKRQKYSRVFIFHEIFLAMTLTRIRFVGIGGWGKRIFRQLLIFLNICTMTVEILL